MLYRELIAVCSQIHTKHINTFCGQNVELFSVKPDGLQPDTEGLKPSSFRKRMQDWDRTQNSLVKLAIHEKCLEIRRISFLSIKHEDNLLEEPRNAAITRVIQMGFIKRGLSHAICP